MIECLTLETRVREYWRSLWGLVEVGWESEDQLESRTSFGGCGGCRDGNGHIQGSIFDFFFYKILN